MDPDFDAGGLGMGERRRAPRQKSLLRGTVHFNNRRNSIDCLIRDISPYGARLVFTDPVAVPEILDLYIPQKEQTLRVHIIWRNGCDAGVAFAQPGVLHGHAPVAASAGDDLAERVQRLEAEIVALRRMLRKLKAGVDGESDAA